MLEIKHLTKIYQTKGGAETTALRDVSVSFGERGLVFLLGKSGSGKSTLLNLAGGLDEPTSGEIVIYGKSSKDFTGSDFDSYRNTYIGFVFQEYNILNEFNVEDNIALALELQGKTHEREKVQAILEEVELGEYAKRKPNTLSGGQKQRIAIARALVKDPQIIMADEPTGALDSATGRQVFDTLKKLSKTRLVLVVSHDRAFAEEYGDRIVELKDGEIISDVTKSREEAEKAGGSVRRVGSNTLFFRGGTADEETMNAIREFIADAKGEIFLSKGEEENANFKRVNRIDDSGACERFVPTKESEIPKSGESAPHFIRSRLPVRKAIKIGASGLKLKPIRLIFTIFLSFISFVMFGLFSTMMLYNEDDVLVESFMASDYEYLKLSKYYEVRVTTSYGGGSQTYTRIQSAKFTPGEVQSFGQNAVGVNSWGGKAQNLEIRKGRRFYQPYFQLITFLPENHPLREKVIAGKYPEQEDEICVSTYFLECAKNGIFRVADKDGVFLSEKTIESAADLVGENLKINDEILRISGVFDSGEIPKKYDSLKEESLNGDFMLEYAFSAYLEETLHELALVNEACLSAHSDWQKDDEIEFFDNCERFYLFSGSEDVIYSTSRVREYQENPIKPQLEILRFDGKTSPLKDNELILSAHFLSGYWNDIREIEQKKLMEEEPDESDFENPEDYETACEEFAARKQAWEAESIKVRQAIQILTGTEIYDPLTDVWREATSEERQAAQNTLQDFFQPFEVPLGYVSGDQYYDEDAPVVSLGQFSVVGIFYSSEGQYRYENGMYCSKSLYESSEIRVDEEKFETKYHEEADAIFTGLLAPYQKTKSGILGFVNRTTETDPETDIRYQLNNRLYSDVNIVNETVELLSMVFLIVGLVFMIFSALLLFNFISMSISNKKREIGILRAVGARGTDVFKIFFSESGIIVGICTLLALIGSVALTFVLNMVLKSEVGLEVTLFVFGPMSVLLMIGVAAFVALISTFLPVYFAARKKPVESIRAL